MDPADFGKYLNQQRELRGMSREHVSNATKIPVSQIAALESGDFRRLPGRHYVLHFIRSYAGVIGLSVDEAVLRYEEIAGSGDAEPVLAGPTPMRDIPLQKSRSVERWLFVALVLVLAIGGAYLLARMGKLPFLHRH